jgi:hypothetical protein
MLTWIFFGHKTILLIFCAKKISFLLLVFSKLNIFRVTYLMLDFNNSSYVWKAFGVLTPLLDEGTLVMIQNFVWDENWLSGRSNTKIKYNPSFYGSLKA